MTIWLLAPALVIALSIPASVPAAADEKSALKAVRGVPKVIDALGDRGGNLYVSVKNERDDWDRFAAHLCKVVRSHQARIFQVRVVDVSTVFAGRKPAEWGKLGVAACG